MSCLRIRLCPAKSAWKRFASKLLKLHRSKPIKKLATRTVKPVLRSDHRPHRRRRYHHQERSPRVFLLRLKRACLFKKKRKAVVYVDKLFRAPIVLTRKIISVDDPVVTWQQKAADMEDADAAWESMGVASPLVHGIDDRAEEFIARVKAEMKSQDKIARAL